MPALDLEDNGMVGSEQNVGSLDGVNPDSDSDIDLANPTKPSMGGTNGGRPANEDVSGDPVDSDETLPTIITDGFVIEKPGPETGSDSDSSSNETLDNTINTEDESGDSVGNIVEGELTEEITPAFVTPTPSTVGEVSNLIESGISVDNGIVDSSMEIDAQNVSSIEGFDSGTTIDIANPIDEQNDNNFVDNTISGSGANVIEGINQIVSSQIDVTDVNDGTLPISSPVNVVDGFEIGSSSVGQGIIGESISNQGDLSSSNNGSAISSIDTGVNSENINQIENNEDNKYQVLSGSLYECKKPGFYPFESNCVEFYVCLEVLPNVLFADQLYRCPKRYLFDEKTRRCQKAEMVTCNKPMFNSLSTNAKENVLVVMEQFVDTFFTTELRFRG